MFKNYFKTAWGNLVRSKGYGAISIGGLAVGMAVAMLIGLWMYDELTFNGYHENYDRIAQLMQHASFNGEVRTQPSNPAAMGPELRLRYGSDFKHVIHASWPGLHMLSIGNTHLVKEGMFFEPGAPEILSLKMLKGSRDGWPITTTGSRSTGLFSQHQPYRRS